MGLAGINQLLKTSKLLREVATIITTNRHLRSSNKLMEPLVQLMGLAMVTVRLLPTVKDKVMAKMATVVIMLSLVMASHSRIQVLDTTSSSKDTTLPTAMPLIQHLMGKQLRMGHKVNPINLLHPHQHLDNRTMLVVNPAQILVTRIKLASLVMGYPHLHRVAMVPNHPTEVMGHLQLRNRAVSQLMHSHSSHLVVLKVLDMLRLDILTLSLHLPSLAMLTEIPVLRDLHRQVTRHLNLAMANNSPHNTVVLTVPDIPSLQHTLLMQPHLHQPNPPGLPKHHPPVNELSLNILFCRRACTIVVACSN